MSRQPVRQRQGSAKDESARLDSSGTRFPAEIIRDCFGSSIQEQDAAWNSRQNPHPGAEGLRHNFITGVEAAENESAQRQFEFFACKNSVRNTSFRIVCLKARKIYDFFRIVLL